MEVNKTWYGLLTSESYKRRVKLMFCKEMQMELWIAINKGNACEVRKITSSGMMDVNYMERKMTPLYLASTKGFKDVVQLLLQEGADPNKVCLDAGWSPLHIAAIHGYIDVVQLLLEEGAEINLQNGLGSTPLFFAVMWSRRDMVQFLLKQGADPNIARRDGCTPLYNARNQTIDVIKLFLRKGVDPNQAVIFHYRWQQSMAGKI